MSIWKEKKPPVVCRAEAGRLRLGGMVRARIELALRRDPVYRASFTRVYSLGGGPHNLRRIHYGWRDS
ncbi:hypothetical protein [Puniceibacterium confluentis]|uniref:hypothetical protein n=1 Tax=Puniceibacterium confluentis TaxID=1958944 RepID=UPI0011B80DEA|nr:hypothetical protein [Puniceibacterium confluentis]